MLVLEKDTCTLDLVLWASIVLYKQSTKLIRYCFLDKKWGGVREMVDWPVGKRGGN